MTIAALAQVKPHEAGLASGLINTNQQIGGAIGVAVASTIFVSRANHLLKTGDTPAQAFTSGYQAAFSALIAIALAGAVVAFVMLRGTKAPEPVGEAGPLSRAPSLCGKSAASLRPRTDAGRHRRLDSRSCHVRTSRRRRRSANPAAALR